MKPEADSTVHEYRIRFFPLYRPFIVMSSVINLVQWGPELYEGLDPFTRWYALLSTAGGLAATGLLSLLLVFLVPVKLASSGISGFTFWGVRRHWLSWPEINSVERRNILGMPYAKVYTSDGGAPLWVSLFVRDEAGFRNAVHESAGEGHALSQLLSK